MDGQMNIFDCFDFLTPEVIDLETCPIENIVEAVRQKTGLDFQYQDELFGFVATYKKVKFTLRFSRYWQTEKHFISCGYGTHTGGAGSPCDSLEEAIRFFERGLKWAE